MGLTALIDVVIGLSLVYLGASLYVTIINEYIAQLRNLRGKQLAKDLARLIDEPSLQTMLKQSPILGPFFDGSTRAGSYVDPTLLAQLLTGGLASGATGVATLKELLSGIEALPNSAVKTQLAALAQSGANNVDGFVQNVSQWVDRSLTTLGEVYKKNMQWLSFAVGFGIAVAFNLDTLELVEHLYRDKEAREATAALAVQLSNGTQKELLGKCAAMKQPQRRQAAECAPIAGLVEAVAMRNATLGMLPIGWETRDGQGPTSLYGWIARLAGWTLTALAVSLGSPFWFDLLNRLVNVRHGMRRPEPVKG